MVILILFPPTSMCFTLKSTPVMMQDAMLLVTHVHRGSNPPSLSASVDPCVLTDRALLVLVEVIVREAQQDAVGMRCGVV
jgi:hypothetical protein